MNECSVDSVELFRFEYKASGAHLEAVHCATVTCYVCYKWCILSGLFNVSLINICGKWDCQFENVQLLLC